MLQLTDFGWYSGDHHVHAAGCAHYESPTEGVTPEDMMRHILGEDLNVGCVLAWGPCWYYQKQFFEGDLNKLSQSKYLMRYDVEVSGFPSSHTGHLCLLANLAERILRRMRHQMLQRPGFLLEPLVPGFIHLSCARTSL